MSKVWAVDAIALNFSTSLTIPWVWEKLDF